MLVRVELKGRRAFVHAAVGCLGLALVTACAASSSPREPAPTAALRGAPEPRRCEVGSRPGADDPTARFAETYAAGVQQAWDASGVLLVERDGVILLERAMGVASHETHAPMTPDTRFAIGSVTKEWTAWLVRDAARNRSVPLDSTLERWFPEVSPWRHITVGQLL